MNIFTTSLQLLWSMSNNYYVFVFLQFISLIFLTSVLIRLLRHKDSTAHISTSISTMALFLVPIVAILAENIDNTVRFILPETWISISFNCLAWVTACFKFYSFLIFIDKLIDHNASFRWYHYTFAFIAAILSTARIADKLYCHMHLIKLSQYTIVILKGIVLFWIMSIIPSIVTIARKLSSQNLPYLIKKQLNILLYYLLLPQMISIAIEFTPVFISNAPLQITAFENLSLILITSSIYFCFKKIMQFRFLNLSKQVQIKSTISSNKSLKEALEHINLATNHQELTYITQHFLSDQIGILKNNITVYIRSSHQKLEPAQQAIEQFLTSTQNGFDVQQALHKHKILVRHEIEFDEFHSSNAQIHAMAEFLRSIQCDVFIPVLSHKNIIGYITIQNQNINTLYSDDQQNMMIVFAQFVAPAIHLMLQKNLYKTLESSKQHQEHLYAKQQEINQYKESIKKLLKDRVENHIGIIFYKNEHFAFKNQEGQELLGFNPNLEPEHPTAATLIHFAKQVEKYQTNQTLYLTMSNDTKLIISGMPHANVESGVLLIVRKPEATDIIKMHIDALKNPSDRDFLLYLETTKAGQTINKLLPNTDEQFIQTKIMLLQSVLQKNTLFFELAKQDVVPLIELIDSLGEQKGFHIIDLAQDDQAAVKLFGINPLLADQEQSPLLEKYCQGTIVLQNIEALDKVWQLKLVQFIKYGIFTPCKSEQRMMSSARIICCSNYKFSALLESEKLTLELAQLLEKQIVSLPSLITMPEAQLANIIDYFMHQNIQEQGPELVQALTHKEKDFIISKRISSIFELKQKVLSLMMLKAQEKLVINPNQSSLNKYIDTTSPELQLAAQLGRHALKDVQLMQNLWKKLGSQTKIADLLGVNRSSVSRRCKDYHLG